MKEEISFDTEKRERLEYHITEMMRRNRVYGLSILITVDDRVLYSRGFGLRSANPPLPATPDTLYGIGSSTKIFTALSILKLVEMSRIRLDDPVDMYIKGLRTDLKGHPVTIHQLLSHTSGFPDLGMASVTLGHPLGEQDVWTPLGSIDDLVTLINGARDERVSEKGDVFMYWNEGYVLLSRVIEEASGMGYPDFVKKNILSPLGMKRSTFDLQDFENDDDIMVGYYSGEDNRKVPQRFPYHPLGHGDGGLISSVSEMGHMVGMMMNGGLWKGRRIIGRKYLDIAMTPKVDVNFPAERGKRISYGYGIVIDDNFFRHVKFGHGGNVAVSSSYFGFIPDLKAAVVVASNSDFGVYSIADYALSLSIGKDPEKLPAIEFQRKADLLIGRYETYKGSAKMQISLKGPNLFMEIGHPGQSNPMPLTIDGDDLFMMVGHNKVKLDVDIRPQGTVDIRFDRLVFHRVGKL